MFKSLKEAILKKLAENEIITITDDKSSIHSHSKKESNLIIAKTIIEKEKIKIKEEKEMDNIEFREFFIFLTKEWKENTKYISSSTIIESDPNYKKIISYGTRSLPLILEDLENNGGFWYGALHSITNANPVDPADVGNIKKMKESWLKWGREHNIIPHKIMTIPDDNKQADTLENKQIHMQKQISHLQEQSLQLREQILEIKEKRFELKVVKQQLVDHKIFNEIKTLEELQKFMSWHVFAVWDFMSLIKRLQKDLTCTTLPWMPNKYEEAARLINDIVLGEETDKLPNNKNHMSHFGLYVEAMKEIKADTSQIEEFIAYLQKGGDINIALSKLPQPIQKFVKYTLDIAINGNLYQVLGSFFYGRENVIPDMFTALLDNWKIDKKDAPMFVYYLERHIELDSGEHGPASEKIINITTEENPVKMMQVLDCAIESVKMRIELWDGIYNLIKK